MQEAIEQEYVVRAERLRQEASAAWAHVTASKADACSPGWKRART
jgi:hypothetical protein